MIEIRETAEYAKWFASLRDNLAKTRILLRIRRISLGNFGDVKPVGKGISELRINYGPEYRLYFVTKGEAVVILLAGGDKQTQAKDIQKSIEIAQSV